MRSRGIRRPLVGILLLAVFGVSSVLVYYFTRSDRPSFASETAYLDTPPPSPPDATRVTTVSSFRRALGRARAGETILAGGRFRITGEFTGFDRVIRGGTVNVVLGPGVRFVGGQAHRPAVWVYGSGGWRIWGGTITNPKGVGLLVYALPGPVTWTGFRVRDTGGTSVAVLPVGGNIDRLTLKGTAGSATANLALDPHAEKGTGIHAWNIADAPGGLVQRSTFAADVVDQATGAGVEIDTGHIGPGVNVYARARHLGFALPGTSWTGAARIQTAGNVIQLWGASPKGLLDLRYIEGADIEGRLVDTTGVSPGADLSQVRVGFVRVSGPVLENPRLSGPAVDAGFGMQVASQARPLTGS